MNRRPIVIKTLKKMIYKGLQSKQIEENESEHAQIALKQLIHIINEFNQGITDLIKQNDKHKRLRVTHLNLIKKQRLKIEVLEKEIEFLKEQRNPTPECYTVEKPNYDADGWDENDFARDLHTSGFQIPRF